jgi:hypothetical protein
MPTAPKRLARVAGVLYLLVGIFGGFAEGYVEPKMAKDRAHPRRRVTLRRHLVGPGNFPAPTPIGALNSCAAAESLYEHLG